MGERCRTAALGATFALLVAACAATETPTVARQSERTVSSTTTVPSTISFADDGDPVFVDEADARGKCLGGDESRLAVYDTTNGSETWSLPIPRPGGLSANTETELYLSFAWDTDQAPGIGAVDLTTGEPIWQRFLPETPQDLELREQQLLVTMRSELLSIDPTTGETRWSTAEEFDLERVIIDDEQIVALTSVGVTGIDAESGHRLWTVPIERPDNLAATDGFVVVSAGPRIVAVDTIEQRAVWEITTDRLRAGEIHLTDHAVIVEASPASAPTGARLTFDRRNGVELLRIEHTSNIHVTDTGLVVTTGVNDEGRPGTPYWLYAIDPVSGEIRWQRPATAPLRASLLAADGTQLVITDPHPAIGGVHRLQLLASDSGVIVWETATVEQWDGAHIEFGAFVSLHRTVDTLAGERGYAGLVLSSDSALIVTERDGVDQPPMLVVDGLLVISGEQSNTCVGRRLGEPGVQPNADDPT